MGRPADVVLVRRGDLEDLVEGIDDVGAECRAKWDPADHAEALGRCRSIAER
ncbi:MAG: hypothetical protein AAGH15_27040 [Myxococcota bacterium]